MYLGQLAPKVVVQISVLPKFTGAEMVHCRKSSMVVLLFGEAGFLACGAGVERLYEVYGRLALSEVKHLASPVIDCEMVLHLQTNIIVAVVRCYL